MKKLCLFVLLFVIVANHALAAIKRQPVELEIPSYDGFNIHATLDIPDYASPKTKAPVVIFLHSICGSQLSWKEIPEQLKEKLYVATLNVDIRGHGKSTQDKNGKNLHWQNLTEPDYMKMPEDIIEIINYLEKQYPEINTDEIAIVGSSLGATVGMMAVTYQKKERIKAVIMLSPMLEYKGFDLRLPIVKYGKHPLMLLVSEKDKYSYESCLELIKFGQGLKVLKSYPNGGHGEDLLKFQPESKDLILKWLKENFTKGKIKFVYEEEDPKRKYKYREIKEYPGQVKVRGDIYGGIH